MIFVFLNFSRMYGFLKLNDPKEEKKKTLVLKVCIF